jgi:hypothetical protein
MSETRDLYPYKDDREVIRAFLTGTARSLALNIDTSLSVGVGGRTLHGDSPSSPIIAFLSASDQALMGQLLSGSGYSHGVRVLEFIARELGLSDLMISRERLPGVTPDSYKFLHFVNGQRVEGNEPFLLCGPLGLQAYRAVMRV